MWKATTTDFNIEKHLIVFLQESPFYAEISRHIRKTASEDLPTAAVTYDPKMDEIGLWYNPSFFEKLSNWEIKGVLTHEFNHLVFGHLAVRRKKPTKFGILRRTLPSIALSYPVLHTVERVIVMVRDLCRRWLSSLVDVL